MKQADGPVVIAGGFNLLPESYVFREYWSAFNDAFSLAGWGVGHTKFTHHSGFRVDHILFSSGWRCRRCWVGPDVGAEHRPVIADLEWTGDQ